MSSGEPEVKRVALAAASVALLLASTAATEALAKKKKTFAERLAAKEVLFYDGTSPPPDPKSKTVAQTAQEELENLEIVRNDSLQQAGVEILNTLIAAHNQGGYGTPPPQLTQFFLIAGDNINCSALPNAKAIACTAHALQVLRLAKENGRDQLAFLLAHELAHITIKSHRERFGKTDKLKKDIITIGVIGAMTGLVVLSEYKKTGNGLTIVPTATSTLLFWNMLCTGSDLSDAIGGLAAPAWGRDDEDDADSYALILMQRAKYRLDAGSQLLKTYDAELRRTKQRTTRIGAILGGGAKGVARNALLTDGDKWSMIAGGITGMFSGATNESATAHYHRSPDRRADDCAEQAGAMEPKLSADIEAALLAKADGATQLAGRPATESLPADSAPATSPPTKRVAGKGGGKRASKKVTPAKPAVAVAKKDGWTRFLENGQGVLDELALSDRVRDHISIDDPQGAIGLCPAKPITGQLALSCGIAYAGLGNAAKAIPLLQQAVDDPYATPETFRRAAQARAALQQMKIALQILAAGHVRFPTGELYPDEISLLAASGDMAGAEKSAETCKKKAEKPYQDACAKVLTAIKAPAVKKDAARSDRVWPSSTRDRLS